MIQLTLTLKMTTAQVDETSVTVNNNSPIQDYVYPDDQIQPTFEMTPEVKPFTVKIYILMVISLIIQTKEKNNNLKKIASKMSCPFSLYHQ